ncbi:MULTISPECIES: cytochrome bc complex cytochrome b subunit [unclassified Wenzhouxiangella]|uniref:cytochrome b n=1 Tax=unclassified Wenzhouxiangella TaxID=2613841 RepID=UPI000E3283AF|nr:MULTISPECIES: cytochrome bc complex cytochrome b subunit [unclassified Wenzhouxiangella]RFF28955.1 cytochrome bc complex cytochrome b subunit [Wenzhouxiangella sp. 15181]RFP68336.1 cytochrome bc complex cytochrome b subunit [Wenzhouxiangella sp. 15190]
MAKPASNLSKNVQAVGAWVDERLPVSKTWREHLTEYYAPKNFNLWYYFGSLAIVVLVIQLVTGIWLTMFYTPHADMAFGSVEFIMRDVEWGWLIRYMHSTGASFFFILVYLHMFRALLYGSYRKPRELIWILGVLILLVMMAEAFMGYVLPWGQMSYWGAQVIISLFGAIPEVGDVLVEWIRGDYMISNATLNRFFALHVVAMPLALLALVVLHLVALHEVGSNNPDGVEIKKHKDEKGRPLDGIPFHPYYTVKDLFGVGVFLILFAFVLFYAPEMGGLFLEPDNFVPADPLVTPEHIVPVWYFTPYYAMLRAVPDKFLGVMVMGAAIFVLFFLPWLDRSKVRSIRYKGLPSKIMLALFVVGFIRLGMLALGDGTPIQTLESRIWTAYYFAFFVLLPFVTKFEKTKPEPDRVTK